jgi:MFS family permease
MMMLGKTRALARRLFPFGWGNVTKLALAYFFSTLYFYIPVGTLYLLGKGLNYVQINSLWGIIVGTMFLTEIPTGMVADRLGRKRAVNLALGLQVLGEVIYVFAGSYSLFALAAVVGGLGFAFGSGCVEALVYDALKADGREGEMSKAMGLIEAAQRLANLLAFPVGGLLARNLTQERFVLAIALTACMVGIGFLISFAVKEHEIEDMDGERSSSARLLVDGMRLLRSNRLFRRLALLALFTVPFRDYLGNLYQPHFVLAGVPPIWFGLSLSIASGLSVLGARYAYWLEAHLGTGLSLAVVTALPGVLYVVMAGVLHPVLSPLVFCLLYGSTSLRGPILAGQLNKHIASGNRATVLSMISMFSGIYVALMGLLFGRIADHSVPQALISIGAVVLLGSVTLSGAVRGTERLQGA